MGAIQAQDHAGALWAIALRTPNLTLPDIEKEIQQRKIVRTWPMRGTLHYVAAEDLRWMQALLTPRVIKSYAGRRAQLGIDDGTLAKAEAIITSSLRGGNSLTRADLYQLFEDGGIDPSGQKGIHLIGYFAHIGLVCHGVHVGKQPTYALVDEWIEQTEPISREESLKRLASRYFKSHGPATIKDFAGWGFMTMADAKLGVELAKDTLRTETMDNQVYWLDADTALQPPQKTAFLLPGFDEFMLGYKDRAAVLDSTHAQKIVPGNNGVFLPTIVIDGRIVGTWKKVMRKNDIIITLLPFNQLSKDDIKALQIPMKRYAAFSGMPVRLAD